MTDKTIGRMAKIEQLANEAGIISVVTSYGMVLYKPITGDESNKECIGSWNTDEERGRIYHYSTELVTNMITDFDAWFSALRDRVGMTFDGPEDEDPEVFNDVEPDHPGDEFGAPKPDKLTELWNHEEIHRTSVDPHGKMYFYTKVEEIERPVGFWANRTGHGGWGVVFRRVPGATPYQKGDYYEDLETWLNEMIKELGEQDRTDDNDYYYRRAMGGK